MSVSYQYRGCLGEIRLVLGSFYSFREGSLVKKIKQMLWPPSPPADDDDNDEEEKCPKGQKNILSQNKLNIDQVVVVWRHLYRKECVKNEEMAFNPVPSYVAQSPHHISVIVVVVVIVVWRHLEGVCKNEEMAFNPVSSYVAHWPSAISLSQVSSS